MKGGTGRGGLGRRAVCYRRLVQLHRVPPTPSIPAIVAGARPLKWKEASCALSFVLRSWVA